MIEAVGDIEYTRTIHEDPVWLVQLRLLGRASQTAGARAPDPGDAHDLAFPRQVLEDDMQTSDTLGSRDGQGAYADRGIGHGDNRSGLEVLLVVRKHVGQ
jgi:hypothetical protein